MRSKNKFIVALSLLLCVVVASVIGVTFVFAASQARASTALNVTYTATANVNATISGGYAVSSFNTSVSSGYTALTFNGENNYTIYPRNSDSSFVMDSTNIDVYFDKYVVFKFAFTNNSTDSTKSLKITPNITKTNSTCYYGAFPSNLTVNCASLSSTPTLDGYNMSTTWGDTRIFSYNATMYAYVVFVVDNNTLDGSIQSISWELEMV